MCQRAFDNLIFSKVKVGGRYLLWYILFLVSTKFSIVPENRNCLHLSVYNVLLVTCLCCICWVALQLNMLFSLMFAFLGLNQDVYSLLLGQHIWSNNKKLLLRTKHIIVSLQWYGRRQLGCSATREVWVCLKLVHFSYAGNQVNRYRVQLEAIVWRFSWLGALDTTGLI